MNYNIEYQFFYDRLYSKLVYRIKQYYIENCTKKRGFGIINNELANYLSKDLDNLVYSKSNSELMDLFLVFNNRTVLYTEDYINLVVENDIIPIFQKINKDDFPKGFNLKKLLINFAFLNARKEISRLLQNHCNLFAYFYEFKEFDNFEIKEYKGIRLEDSPIYKDFNKRKYPENYHTEINDSDINSLNDINLKTITLPLAITILKEIGFFELEKIKSFSDQKLSKIISIIQQKDPKDRNVLRSISGNVRMVTGGNDNAEKYTAGSTKNTELAKKLLDEIKSGE